MFEFTNEVFIKLWNQNRESSYVFCLQNPDSRPHHGTTITQWHCAGAC